MEFKKLKTAEFKLLLKAFEIDINKEKCRYCEEKLQMEKIGFMPSIKKEEQYILICDNVLCMTKYLSDIEEINNAKK